MSARSRSQTPRMPGLVQKKDQLSIADREAKYSSSLRFAINVHGCILNLLQMVYMSNSITSSVLPDLFCKLFTLESLLAMFYFALNCGSSRARTRQNKSCEVCLMNIKNRVFGHAVGPYALGKLLYMLLGLIWDYNAYLGVLFLVHLMDCLLLVGCGLLTYHQFLPKLRGFCLTLGAFIVSFVFCLVIDDTASMASIDTCKKFALNTALVAISALLVTCLNTCYWGDLEESRRTVMWSRINSLAVEHENIRKSSSPSVNTNASESVDGEAENDDDDEDVEEKVENREAEEEVENKEAEEMK